MKHSKQSDFSKLAFGICLILIKQQTNDDEQDRKYYLELNNSADFKTKVFMKQPFVHSDGGGDF